MSKPNSGRVNEKSATVSASVSEQPLAKKAGIFSRNKRKGEGSKDEKAAVDVTQISDADPAPQDIPPVPFTELFRFATRFELTLNFIGLLAAGASGVAQPLMTLVFGTLIQGFVNFEMTVLQAHSGDLQAQNHLPAAAVEFRHSSAKTASYLVYMGIALFCCTFTSMSVWVYTGEIGAKRLREHYLRAVLRQDIAFFDNVGAGEIATRIQTDTHLVQEGISEKVTMITTLLVCFISGFVLAYVRSWRLALAISSILPAMAIVGAIMNIFMSRCTKSSLQHIAEGGTLAEEAISTVRTAQAFGIQSTLADIYDIHINRSKKIETQSAILQGVGIAVFFFVVYAAYGLAFSFGATLINQGHANAGTVVNVVLAIFIGSISLVMLAPEMQSITRGCGAAAKLFQVIDRVPDIDSADPGGLKLQKVEGHITFENVNFYYPSRPDVPVLKDLSVTFAAGKSAALVGASGSGKSTIVSLIERFYDPLSGAIKLDGVDIKELNVKWLRTQIGLVSQEPTLFSTTIQGNVAHGLIGTEYENASEEKKLALIKEACIKANADNFINDMPLGYDTLVGERGFLMSGGQKQRIAIARAIVADPKILLLDEATSALDTRSEGVVQDALNKATIGRTTITIAHRLSTIKDADCIFVMNDGLVLEHGTHSQLLRDPDGPYSCLVTAQKLRDRCDVENKDLDSASDDPKDIKQKVGEELVRKNTGHTLASDIEHRKDHGGEKEQDHNLFYVFTRMGKLNRSGWLNYVFGVVAASMSGMVYPAFGIVYATGLGAFSSLDPHQRRHDGDRVALWFFLIAIISIILSTVQNYMFASTAATLTAKLRCLSFRAILRQDIAFFDSDEHSTGSLTSNLSDNPQKVNGLAGVTLGAIVQSVATLVSASIIGLIFSWKLGLVSLACMPVLVFFGYTGLRVVLQKDKRTKKAHENSAHIACEAAGTIRTVASLTREDDCVHLYSQRLEEPLQQAKRSAVWRTALFAGSQAITFFVSALAFWYGSRLVSTFEVSNFAFLIVLMSTTFGYQQATSAFAFVPDMGSAKSAGSDIISLMDSVPEIDAESPDGKKVAVENISGRIRFQNIHFRYPTRPDVRVLRDLSFKAEPGTYIALVGASGSGKSTIIQLIERFYNPWAGQIYLDDELISELNLQEYRQQIALVSQEPTLYSGTVRFNILLGAIKPHAEVTQEEIERACRDANILDFINSLPNGFDTEVGGKGSQLSGGQKQRIAIARGLIRNPKVLLLDEATSALDSSSEHVVQEALDQAAKGRTTIAIAHRLSTIQNADCIYFIKEGRICESGTHDELLQKKGDYYEYVQLQALSKN